MNSERFLVSLTGETINGADRKKTARLLAEKLAAPVELADGWLNGEPVRLQENLDFNSATDLAALCHKAGARTRIESMEIESASTQVNSRLSADNIHDESHSHSSIGKSKRNYSNQYSFRIAALAPVFYNPPQTFTVDDKAEKALYDVHMLRFSISPLASLLISAFLALLVEVILISVLSELNWNYRFLVFLGVFSYVFLVVFFSHVLSVGITLEIHDLSNGEQYYVKQIKKWYWPGSYIEVYDGNRRSIAQMQFNRTIKRAELIGQRQSGVQYTIVENSDAIIIFGRVQEVIETLKALPTIRKLFSNAAAPAFREYRIFYDNHTIGFISLGDKVSINTDKESHRHHTWMVLMALGVAGYKL